MPLVSSTVDVAPFNRDAHIAALRTDQVGNSTFQEFLTASWQAGVVRYDVELRALTRKDIEPPTVNCLGGATGDSYGFLSGFTGGLQLPGPFGYPGIPPGGRCGR